MKYNIDQLKNIDLVKFCELGYGLQFQRQGNVFVSRSPFKEEQNPSFVVHQKNGHWLFKDFSSGNGGSIIDLVRDLEHLPADYATIAARIETLLMQQPGALASRPSTTSGWSTSAITAGAKNIDYVFQKIQQNNLKPSQDYLQSRGLSDKVIADLQQRSQLFTNVYQGKSYCCFVVRDASDRLMCLDNHQIDGSEKFVLGSKHVFVPDYNALAQSEEVVITAGIIDLLSMETMFFSVGLALLGNGLDFSPELIASSNKLVLALDNDAAGDLGKEKIRSRFSDRQFEDFSVGDYKDPNEVLMAFPKITTKRKKYSPQEKLQIYKQFQRCRNKSAVARQFGIDRSYLSEIIAECDEVLLAHFGQKKPGRKKADEPRTMAQSIEQIQSLKSQNLELAQNNEQLYISNEFIKLQLCWAERDGFNIKNRHLKKKAKQEVIDIMNRLTQQAVYTTKGNIIEISDFLSSRLYVWQQEIVERKKRAPQIYAEEVNAALNNIVSYPYMGGKKGALMLAYHQIEYIGQRSYDFVKKLVKGIIYAEIKHRNLERDKPQWTKIAAKNYGEIWCADFTHLELYGQVIYIAVVLDDYSHYYLGYNVSATADVELVDAAFEMALETCQGVLPEICMVNDRGSQYQAEFYKEHVKKYEIAQVFIPKGTPWNNSEAEVGMKDIQALIYQRLAHSPRKRGQDIVKIAWEMAKEVFKELNDKIARLKLDGVTPADVVAERAEAKRASTKTFIAERIAQRPMKKRIDDLNQYISKKLDLNKWSDRSLKNLVYLINHKYKLIVPEKGVG